MTQNWAIAIGINEYEFLPSLRYAERDAIAIRQFLLQEAHFDRVFFFTDTSPDIGGKSTRPSRANLRRLLRQLFAHPFMADGDNFWLFFSGHGMRYQERDYLMPIDGDPEDVTSTGIPTNYITEQLRQCGADNVVMVLDACRNEGREMGHKGSVGLGTPTDSSVRATGVISLFSCSPYQFSYEIEALQQGAFTTVLLEGLGLQGQCATVEHLNQYLKARVPELVKQHFGRANQVPYVIAEPVERSHLILMPQYATSTDIVYLKNDAARAERHQEWATAQQLWLRVLAASAGQDMDAVEALQTIAVIRAVGQNPPEPTPASTMAHFTQSAKKSAAVPSSSTTPAPLPIVTPATSTAAVSGSAISTQPAAPAPLIPPPPIPPSPHPPTAESPQKHAADPAIALPTFSFTTVYADETGTVSQQIEAQAVYFTEHLDEQVSFDMVKIPGGVFTLESPDAMGQSSECPPCRITVPSFYLGKYVVTQALYERIMGVNPATQYDPNQFVAPDKPVVGVRWQDAIAFCQKLTQRTGRNYRLPSEAEWEYACRAETQTAYYFGNKIAPDLANYGLNIDQTAKVGRYPPNGFGLFEMHGNVWEWCADHWHDNYRQTQIPAGSPPVNSSPTGLPPEGQPWTQDGHQGYRVIRGGSWCDVPENCRSASRRRCSIDAQSRTNQPAICFSNRIGFRIVVSTLSPQPQLASCAPKDESDEVITEILPPPSDPVALMTVDLIPPHNGSTAESPSLVELAQLAITPDLNLPSQSSSLPPQPQSEPMTSASITSASIPSASITSASMASAPMNSSQPYVFATPQVNNRGVIVKQIQQEAVSFTEILKDGPYFTLLQIPGGTLMMGSLDGEGRAVERPQHQVTIPPFWMSQHLVTQAVYGAIMGHNPSLFQGDNRPVEKVSWYDAIAFCSHLSQQTGRRYSLPSEAVWEYACRANGHTKYTFGDALAPELANYNKSLNQTSDVGCYVPNGFGIFDLHGNVWEWCADNWHQNYHGAPTDGRSWETGYSYRVVRGGSWNLNSRFCRSAYRNRLHAHISDPTVGFRVVLMESDSRGDRPNFP